MQREMITLAMMAALGACHTQDNVPQDGASTPATPVVTAAVPAATLQAMLPQASGPGACFDLSRGEPRSLTGQLRFAIAAGPPGFEDVQKGDTPEPIYVLHLDAPICIVGDDFADPSDRFDEVQVLSGKVPESALKAMINQRVTLGLYDGMAAENGHHHRPLVAWVNAVTPAPADAAADTADDDPTADYGTAATTIRAFYTALHAGQGDTAAQMVVPEKRGAGPFSGPALSAFYGSLRAPVDLRAVAPLGADTWSVRYHYATGSKVCDGRAIVETQTRGGRAYIARIRALDGC